MPSNVEYVSLGRVRIGDFGYSYGYGRARLLFFNTDRRADLAVAVAKVSNLDTALYLNLDRPDRVRNTEIWKSLKQLIQILNCDN